MRQKWVWPRRAWQLCQHVYVCAWSLCAEDGKICVLDFGLMTEVTPTQRIALFEYIAHLTTQVRRQRMLACPTWRECAWGGGGCRTTACRHSFAEVW